MYYYLLRLSKQLVVTPPLFLISSMIHRRMTTTPLSQKYAYYVFFAYESNYIAIFTNNSVLSLFKNIFRVSKYSHLIVIKDVSNFTLRHIHQKALSDSLVALGNIHAMLYYLFLYAFGGVCLVGSET